MESAGKKLLNNLRRSWRNFDRRRLNPKYWDPEKLGCALRSMFHPLESCQKVKYEGAGSLLIANVLCLIMLILAFVEYSAEGFIFNYNVSENFNFLVTLLSSSLLMFLWSVSNWGICSLLDGEGTFREIWIGTCYAMLPRCIFSPIMLILSHFFVLEEQSIYSILNSLILIWCGVLLILNMMVTHQYTVRKTIVSALLSIAGIAIILFLCFLLVSMSVQLISFVETIFMEIQYRI